MLRRSSRAARGGCHIHSRIYILLAAVSVTNRGVEPHHDLLSLALSVPPVPHAADQVGWKHWQKQGSEMLREPGWLPFYRLSRTTNVFSI